MTAAVTDRTSLEGRVAIVTGGSRGIGLASARALAQAGAHVIVTARHLDACEEAAGGLVADGCDAIAVRANAGDPDDIAATVATAMQRWGRVDVVVNNAATNPVYGPLIDVPASAMEKILSVNLHGAVLLVREAVRAWMGAHGGSVVNVSSIGGIVGEPDLGAYNASKAALINATKTLARELGSRRIRVNAVAPGLIDTAFARVMVETPSVRDPIVASTALGRVGRAQEVGDAVAWLASDAASYVTGAVLVVDGGATA